MCVVIKITMCEIIAVIIFIFSKLILQATETVTMALEIPIYFAKPDYFSPYTNKSTKGVKPSQFTNIQCAPRPLEPFS
jgi:hypothetical protein